MTDFIATPNVPAPAAPSSSLVATTLVLYVLFGIAAIAGLVSAGIHLVWPLASLVGVIAVILAYAKRADAAATWLASHYRWLIRTFWFSFLWGCVGLAAFVTLIGIPIAIAIWCAASLWVVYRVVRGFLSYTERRPLPM